MIADLVDVGQSLAGIRVDESSSQHKSAMVWELSCCASLSSKKPSMAWERVIFIRATSGQLGAGPVIEYLF
jgi:hypothetical protein